ncbi:MAG: hypothetical protein IKK65_02725 [Clostridia bacterium]|nr:hypothetical protein [Clostridia bacterium]
MNDIFPLPLTNETDLEVYEEYLKNEFSENRHQPQTLTSILKGYIGKNVKADCAIGNRLESRIGLLTDVGENFLIIKPPNRQELIIHLGSLKFLSILQNNTKLPHY